MRVTILAVLFVIFAGVSALKNECRPQVNVQGNTCSIRPDDIRLCAQDETPVTNITNFCPSCRVICTLPELQNCRTLNLPQCIENEQPSIQSCCLTCRPELPVCTLEKLDACKENYSNLTVCEAGVAPSFNKTTCCYDCRIASPLPGEGPVNGTCNQTNFERCLENSAVCENGEFPQYLVDEYCCPTCKRPQRLCTKEDIAACRNLTFPCEEDEVPIYAAGSCCPSCYIPPPTCETACNNTQVCARRPLDEVTGESQEPLCRKIDQFIIDIQVLSNITRRLVSNFTCEQFLVLVKEMVARYCDKNENYMICKQFEEVAMNLALKLNETCRLDTEGVVKFNVTCPENSNNATNYTSLEFFSDVFSDDEATEGYDVSIDEFSGAAGLSFSVTILTLCLALYTWLQN